MTLLCNFQVDLSHMGERFSLDYRSYFADDLPQLEPLVQDGLVEPLTADGQVRMTPNGLPFVRLAAMAFDRYLDQGKARYSKTL